MSKVPVESPAAARASTDRLSLRAGPLTMVFDGGDLRTIRLGGCEIIRRIYAVSITLFETIGWRGVLKRDAGSPLPDRFPSDW